MIHKIFFVVLGLIFATNVFAGEHNRVIKNGRPAWATEDFSNYTDEQTQELVDSFLARCNLKYNLESCKCAFLVFMSLSPDATIDMAYGERNILSENALMRMPSIIQNCKMVGNDAKLLF